MATKTLTIMEDAYNLLAAQKQKTESFSDVIRRLTKNQPKDIRSFAGCLKEYDLGNLKKQIYDERENNDLSRF